MTPPKKTNKLQGRSSVPLRHTDREFNKPSEDGDAERVTASVSAAFLDPSRCFQHQNATLNETIKNNPNVYLPGIQRT